YFGLFPAMSLHDADDNIVAVFASGTGLLQHFVGLADARRRTHKDLELADAAFFPSGRREQGFRRGPLIKVATLICHQTSGPETGPEAGRSTSFPPRRAPDWAQEHSPAARRASRKSDPRCARRRVDAGDLLACYAPSQHGAPGTKQPPAR